MTTRQRALLSFLHRRQRHGQNGAGKIAPWFLLLPAGGFLTFLILVPLFILAAMAVAGFIGYNMLASELRVNLETLRAVDQRDVFQTTRITDRNGVVLYEIFDEGRRTPVPLDRIPKYLRDATIATEDDTFYTNPGFDMLSVARAVYQNITGTGTGGASTITQQLVRHLVFDYEERVSRSYERKLKEVMLAWVLTQTHSKDQILEMYLNEIYYGNLAYGVQAASKTVFLNEKGEPADVSELNLAESALLAGLPQLPYYLDPLTKDEIVRARVKARQRQVLDLMVRHRYLSQAEADVAYAQPLRFNYRDEVKAKEDFKAPHFVVYARQELEKLLTESGKLDPKIIGRGGLTIRTTIDLDLQGVAERVARAQVEKLKDQHVTNAALVALRPDTGEIMAMLGSVDYWNDSIHGRVNVAVRERQPGSSIKPITYATAFAQGITPATILWDVPMTVPLASGQNYTPKNYDEKFHGPVRLRTALANSYNIPALKLLQRVGIGEMIDTAHRMGITGLNRGLEFYGLSVTLGGGEVTPLDLATAYATLANGGNYVKPVAILDVTDAEGRSLYQYSKPEPQPVLDPRAAYLVTHILSDNNARSPAFGANSPLRLSQPAAAKTGTTNDYRDNWTLGYTPYLVTGVWVGNSDNSPMIKSSGVTGAAPIWHDFMEGVFSNPARLLPFRRADGSLPQSFTRPPELEAATVCRVESLRGQGPDCPETSQELFLKGTAPQEGDPELQKVSVVPLPEPIAEAGGEDDPSPAIRWCMVDSDLNISTGEVHQALFVTPPSDEKEASEVYAWAEGHFLPIVPQVACEPNILAAAHVQPSGGQPSANYRITSPAPGAVLHGVVPIQGMAVFNPDEIAFYKLEWGEGDAPAQFTTMGDTHPNPVVDGVLETFHADAVPPGPIVLRLLLVKKDTNYLPPYEVKVQVAH